MGHQHTWYGVKFGANTSCCCSGWARKLSTSSSKLHTEGQVSQLSHCTDLETSAPMATLKATSCCCMRTRGAVGGAAQGVADGAVHEGPCCAAVRRRRSRRGAAVGGAAGRLRVRGRTAAQARPLFKIVWRLLAIEHALAACSLPTHHNLADAAIMYTLICWRLLAHVHWTGRDERSLHVPAHRTRHRHVTTADASWFWQYRPRHAQSGGRVGLYRGCGGLETFKMGHLPF